MAKEASALKGIEMLSSFIDEMEIPRNLRDVGATEEMLSLIAESSIKGGGYKYMNEYGILTVLKDCY